MKTQFKAESKRLLDLMIHSIYTHKEIFIRELISNASDAIDKRYFLSLKNEDTLVQSDLCIELSVDKVNRTLTIQDNGIGMNEEDLHQYLGTIAKSDSLDFKKMIEDQNVDIIGQFGVGFYSAFMVADKIQVYTQKRNEGNSYLFESSGEEGYEITQLPATSIGTKIVLHIKASTEDEDYERFLDEQQLQFLVKKYSDYIRYPIKMWMENTVYDEEGKTKDTVLEQKTLNSMIPLWKKAKSEISQTQYNEFYQDKFHDFSEPLLHLHTSVEGNVSFNALLYIPSHLPYNYYSNEYKKGLQLYSSGVFIMEHAEDLIPEHFRFVRGLVDSYDLSLNISRELLQHNRQLTQIGKIIERKIKSELLHLLKNNRERYEQFWDIFGSQIKYGVYQDFGAHKETLVDLLLFYSNVKNKYVTLEEMIENKAEKVIYYATGDSIDKLKKMPQVVALATKNEDVLLFSDRVDEFAITMLREYKNYVFKNVTSSDVEVLTKEEIEKVEEKQQQDQTMLEKLKTLLDGKVEEVILSKKLTTHAVCLSSKDGISLEMEKTLNALPNQEKVFAKKVLELNPNHEVYQTLEKLYEENDEKLQTYIDVLYKQALLIEGFDLEDPVLFSTQLCELMVNKK